LLYISQSAMITRHRKRQFDSMAVVMAVMAVVALAVYAPGVSYAMLSSSRDLTLAQPWPRNQRNHRQTTTTTTSRQVQSTTGSATVCTVEEFVFDDCSYDADGVCDAGTALCTNAQSDCFDCDPCQAYASSCAACTTTTTAAAAANKCVWCAVPSLGISVCSSELIAAIVPNICINSGSDGTSYQSTCANDDDSSSTPGTNTSTTTPGTSTDTCDLLEDACPLQLNGKCEANGISCPYNSDCFDCDPCMAYRFDGCATCVAANCLWCEDDAVCVSKDGQIMPEFFTCDVDTGFSSTCPTPTSTPFYPDPFYPAQLWMYELINVLPVWESGISTYAELKTGTVQLCFLEPPLTLLVIAAGSGIGIRINDDGVDYTNEEFSGKFSVDASCSVYTPVALDASHSHGTTCASLAAGNGGAGSPCAVGVAPDATLSACRVVPENPPRLDSAVASEVSDYSFLYDRMETMHVSSNSYGIDPCQSIPKQSKRRHLQSCPFAKNSTTSPCVVDQCANVDWSSSTLTAVSTLSAVSATNGTCRDYVTVYCRILFERDTEACTSYLDLYVQCEYNSQSEEQLQAMEKGVTEGRNGKGIVYVFASGNTYSAGTDVNFEGALNSRLTISVGAVGKEGKHASYSITGAPLFVSAPGGDFDTYTNNIVALAGGGCTDGGVGTSFAAPIISGVAALILQANQGLSWRDVQGILAQTSKQVDPDDESWTLNGAGFHHSYLYGFGLVDANAAVTAASTWSYFSTELQIVEDSGAVNIPIPDYLGGAVTSSVTVDTVPTFAVESVIVYLDLTHSTRGDLQIVLTSPAGTASILAPGQRPENSQVGMSWKLMTVRKWGEAANGNWTLSLVDQRAGDLSTCVDVAGWSISFGTTDPVELDCGIFRRASICVDGAAGPGFTNLFSNIATDLTDPFFSDENGVGVSDACCVCGGGVQASALKDVLRSWRLLVYGRDVAVTGPDPSPTTILPLETNAPAAGSTVPPPPTLDSAPANFPTGAAAPVTPPAGSPAGTRRNAPTSGAGAKDCCSLLGWQTVLLVIALSWVVLPV
jgi:subtilisin family serine protease